MTLQNLKVERKKDLTKDYVPPKPMKRIYAGDGPVVVQYLHHAPSGSRIREEIADVPTWVCDSKTLQKFVEEMHPRHWDGDFYEED